MERKIKMDTMRKTLLLLILIIGLSEVVYGQAKKTAKTDKEKIEALIQSVEDLENAKFYRNGSVYNAKEAGSHLRMKVRKAGERIKTVEDFIEKIASKSSMSGENYKIIYDDGKEIITNTFFYTTLETLE